MKTLTVEEATPSLGRLVELALAGEQIQICKGNGVVELRPAQAAQTSVVEELTPREALRRLQEDALLTPQQAECICAKCARNGWLLNAGAWHDPPGHQLPHRIAG